MIDHQPLHIADRAAASRGMALTGTKREVLAHIAAAMQPLTAYQILDLVQKQRGKPVMPPTIYRAVNFLVEQGFVHRLESLNAFVACADLDHHHAGQFVICDSCGRTEELADATVSDRLAQDAKGLGFTLSHQTVELHGVWRSVPVAYGAACLRRGIAVLRAHSGA